MPHLEESNVDEGGVVVDKLEEEHLQCEGILILCLCPGHLQVGQPHYYLLVELNTQTQGNV